MVAFPESLTELAEQSASGVVCSVALVRRSLDRIAALDPLLGAFSQVFGPESLAAAAQLDAERHSGRIRGPLHGLPIAIKDNFDVRGRPTTAGSRLYGHEPADRDAAVLTLLQQAGAVIIGKTTMQELAFGGWGTNAVFGTPRNPWDVRVHRVPGGSSSGSAVAVAAGLVPAALGTDTGGSIRIPAAVCGLVGLKTTLGQISREGVLPLSRSLDTIGPMTHTVADARLLYSTLIGSARSGTFPSPVRVGVPAEPELGEMEPAVREVFRRAQELLAGDGVQLSDVGFTETFESLVERNGLLIAAEGWQLHGSLIEAHGEQMDPAVLARFAVGRNVSAADYAAALMDQLAAQQQAQTLFTTVDAVLTPTVPLAAIPVADVDEAVLPFNRYTRAVNYLGLCAVAVPAGRNAGGLPLSLQLIGAPDSEFLLLELAALLERGFGRLPPAPGSAH